MQKLISHIAPLGKNPEWIRAGILYFDWNYLVILTTAQKEYFEIANNFKNELNQSFQIKDQRKLDSKLIRHIEIIEIDTRKLLSFIEIIKAKAREIKKLGYDIYFNATSGLELWKFAAYFIASVEHLIDKVYYIPKDQDPKEPIKPLEIHLPIPLAEPLKDLLTRLATQKISQKDLVIDTGLSKGLISRYLKELRRLGLIEISISNRGRERFFKITEKGKWYL